MIKAAVLCYPMLYQSQGGLQVQIRESLEALRRRGVDARLIDPNMEKLTSFDVIHVFSAINGNHRIVELAKSLGLPTVCSPLVRPHWNRNLGQRGRLLDRLVGRLTNWEIKTEYRQIDSCLKNSDFLLALGEAERESIIRAFRIPADRIRVVPNGIPERFFSATPEAARSKLDSTEPYLLCVATIDPHKNQLTLARATARSGYRLLLIGQCLPNNHSYLAQLLTFPHVTYLGKLEYGDPLLASFYAAAEAFCLTSDSEVMPLCVLEALAAGTPVIMTRNHSMSISELGDVILEVSPKDEMAINLAVEHMTAAKRSRNACSDAVRQFSWDTTAALIHETYIDALKSSRESKKSTDNAHQSNVSFGAAE